jgi:hypothetical protein
LLSFAQLQQRNQFPVPKQEIKTQPSWSSSLILELQFSVTFAASLCRGSSGGGGGLGIEMGKMPGNGHFPMCRCRRRQTKAEADRR